MTSPGWRQMAPGALISRPGSTDEYQTGTWRAERPVVDVSGCSHCMLCWLFCPEGAIETEGGRFVGFDLDHCKGCGLCAAECPPGVIETEPEGGVQ